MKTQFHDWFYGCRVERTLKALQKNNFDARYAATVGDALEEIFAAIPVGAAVGVGGSQTLIQIGFFEEAERHRIKLGNPSMAAITVEEFVAERRKILLSDVFLASSNAVTEDGKLFNVDGMGNRTSGMTFGPKKVILVAGVNKIVKDLDAAHRRVREVVAPMNARRLDLKTPCAETGVCVDCASPYRICNAYLVLAKRPARTEFMVLLVGEELGF
ncbi:MAG: lactate utilization protein [Syntrophobacterales bacterium]|jgi:hypothetical protein|nr:lactate utilization protein [Syntrophobacterales bacterium]